MFCSFKGNDEHKWRSGSFYIKANGISRTLHIGNEKYTAWNKQIKPHKITDPGTRSHNIEIK